MYTKNVAITYSQLGVCKKKKKKKKPYSLHCFVVSGFVHFSITNPQEKLFTCYLPFYFTSYCGFKFYCYGSSDSKLLHSVWKIHLFQSNFLKGGNTREPIRFHSSFKGICSSSFETECENSNYSMDSPVYFNIRISRPSFFKTQSFICL